MTPTPALPAPRPTHGRAPAAGAPRAEPCAACRAPAHPGQPQRAEGGDEPHFPAPSSPGRACGASALPLSPLGLRAGPAAAGGARRWRGGPAIRSRYNPRYKPQYKPRGCGSALRAARGAVSRRGCGSRCPACGGFPPALATRRHGVVWGSPQLSLRVRHPPHRADPQPQSGAHQPRGAARHPRLRDRVSGQLWPRPAPGGPAEQTRLQATRVPARLP